MADLAEGEGAELEKKGIKKEKSTKETTKTKTQTFRDARGLSDYVSKKEEAPEKIDKAWKEKLAREILYEIVDTHLNKGAASLIDDSKNDLLQSKGLFVKLPFQGEKKTKNTKSLLTELLGKV